MKKIIRIPDGYLIAFADEDCTSDLAFVFSIKLNVFIIYTVGIFICYTLSPKIVQFLFAASIVKTCHSVLKRTLPKNLKRRLGKKRNTT